MSKFQLFILKKNRALVVLFVIVSLFWVIIYYFLNELTPELIVISKNNIINKDYKYCVSCATYKLPTKKCEFIDPIKNSNMQHTWIYAPELMISNDILCHQNSKYPFKYNINYNFNETIFETINNMEQKWLEKYKPPEWDKLTKSTQNGFSLNGSIYVKSKHFNEMQNDNNFVMEWRKEDIDRYVNLVKYNDSWDINEDIFTYGSDISKRIRNNFLNDKWYDQLINSSVVVIGSQYPWIEVLLLSIGVRNVTTLEYGTIISDHEQLNWLHPSKLTKDNQYINSFDHAVTFSSIEHAGLGRYGDPIDPFLDVKLLLQISCLIKPNGLLFIGFPTGMDKLYYNAHRIYGYKRLSLIFYNFHLIFIGDVEVGRGKGYYINKSNQGYNQAFFVLQNKRGCI